MKSLPAETSSGFTLVELLAVMAIIALLIGVTVSALNSGFGTNFDSELSDLVSTFARARTYSVANNTYTFVGISEVDSSGGTQSPGVGRIITTILATNDGSRGYDPTSTSLPITIPQNSSTTNPTSFIIVAPLRHYDSLHLVALNQSAISTFGPAYPLTSVSMSPVPFYDLAVNSSSASMLTFSRPLGGSQFSFGNTNAGSIIQFNPQGEAQIFTNSNSDSFYQWIELGVIPIHGDKVPAQVSNQASIVIDGASGAVSLFRS